MYSRFNVVDLKISQIADKVFLATFELESIFYIIIRYDLELDYLLQPLIL